VRPPPLKLEQAAPLTIHPPPKNPNLRIATSEIPERGTSPEHKPRSLAGAKVEPSATTPFALELRPMGPPPTRGIQKRQKPPASRPAQTLISAELWTSTIDQVLANGATWAPLQYAAHNQFSHFL
jgi:hypothetical protein